MDEGVDPRRALAMPVGGRAHRSITSFVEPSAVRIRSVRLPPSSFMLSAKLRCMLGSARRACRTRSASCRAISTIRTLTSRSVSSDTP